MYFGNSIVESEPKGIMFAAWHGQRAISSSEGEHLTYVGSEDTANRKVNEKLLSRTISLHT